MTFTRRPHTVQTVLNEALESETHALKTITYPHHEIHSGSAYMIYRTLALPVANDDEIRIATPNTTKWAHFTFTATSDASVTVSLYEATSLAHVGGNAITPVNQNRNSSNTSGLTICHTPTGSGDGTLIYNWTAGTDHPTGEGGTATRNEIILKQNTAYLLRIAGASGDVVNIHLDWYEHTDKE